MKIKKQLKPPPRTGFLGGKALVSNSDCLSSNRCFGGGERGKNINEDRCYVVGFSLN